MALQEPNADGRDRQLWLSGIERVLQYVNIVRVGASYIAIDKDDKNKLGKMQIRLKKASIESQSRESEGSMAELKRFFRSYDDGLLGKYMEQPESDARKDDREVDHDEVPEVAIRTRNNYSE